MRYTTAIMAFTAAAIIGLAGCGAPTPSAITTSTSSSCTDFVAAADTLVDLQTEAIGLAGEAMHAIAAGDQVRLNEITDEVTSMQSDVGDARTDYDAAHDDCEGS